MAEHESKNLEDQNAGITCSQKVGIEKGLVCLFRLIYLLTYFSFLLVTKKRKSREEVKYKQ